MSNKIKEINNYDKFFNKIIYPTIEKYFSNIVGSNNCEYLEYLGNKVWIIESNKQATKRQYTELINILADAIEEKGYTIKSRYSDCMYISQSNSNICLSVFPGENKTVDPEIYVELVESFL